MKQITLTVEAKEYDESKFPLPCLPRQIYKASCLYLDVEDDIIVNAASYIAHLCGLEGE